MPNHMSGYESYLFNQQLPDNEFYRVAHNIVTMISVLVFSFTYLIAYLSPSNKESSYYKALVHSQAISLFFFCFTWSFMLKYVTHLNRGFFYSEGYSHFIGLTSAGGYVLLCIFFGGYASSLSCVYLFRLYLLVDHTHLLRMPNVFPAVSIVIVILNVMVSTILFVIGYSEFDPKTLSLNLTWEQLDYLYSKTVVSYRIRSFQEAVYPIYLGADIIISALISVLIIYNTVHHIKKKQSLMSAGATKHHLRVLRILTIQTLSMLGISCVAPFAVGLTLLIDVHSYIVTFSLIVLGFNSVVNSLLTLFFNPVLKRTILTFPKSKSTALRSSVFLVESVYK